MVLGELGGAHDPAGLLVGHGHEDDVALERVRSRASARTVMSCMTPMLFMSMAPRPHR